MTPRRESLKSVTVEDLCKRHRVDLAHARHVAAMSLALFDGLMRIHQLRRSRRGLLEAAALLHNIAFASDPENHHVAGRDLILAETLDGFSAEERDVLACTTLFHRKKVRPRKEPVFQRLRESVQEMTLVLAALLRVGDALDYSQTQTCRIISIEHDRREVRVVVGGPHAKEEAARANRKADLWNKVLSRKFTAQTAAEAVAKARKVSPARSRILSAARPASPASDRRTPGLLGDDSMADAGRKVFRLYFERLLRHKAQTLETEDIEAVHQMRVATRRIRAALRLFGPYLPARYARPLRKGLGRMARALGPVRDLDVLLDKAERHDKSLAAAEHLTLDPLLQCWQQRRARARRKMLKYLNGKKCETFLDAFVDLFRVAPKPGEAETGRPQRRRRRGDLLRHVAPAMIWRQYHRVRDYEGAVEGASPETLHALRIQCKRLRYMLELLREILGPSAHAAIAPLKKAQDYLGELHDTDVTVHLAQDFLDRAAQPTVENHVAGTDLSGVRRYLADCEKEMEEEAGHFPTLWAELVSESFRKTLGEAAATA